MGDIFQVDWAALLLSAKGYVGMVAESNLGWTINVVIWVFTALLAGRIIYVAFGGRNSGPSARGFKQRVPSQSEVLYNHQNYYTKGLYKRK